MVDAGAVGPGGADGVVFDVAEEGLKVGGVEVLGVIARAPIDGAHAEVGEEVGLGPGFPELEMIILNEIAGFVSAIYFARILDFGLGE